MATKQILNSSTAPDGSQYVTLTDGAGNLVTAGGSSGITIGTTTVTGGATTQVLFNLAGVVSSDSGLTYAGSGGVLTLTGTAAANTSFDGLVLSDTTVASSTNQQFSPRLRLTGQGWKTTATAASQPVDWIIENQPVQGTTAPTGNLVFSSQNAGGGYTNFLSVIPVTGNSTRLQAFGHYLQINAAGVGSDSTFSAGFNVNVNNAIVFGTGTTTKVLAPSDGIMQFINNAGTSFTQIDLGPNTSSFPAIGIEANSLEFRTANNTTGANAYYHWGGQAQAVAQYDATSNVTLTNVPGLSVTVFAGKTYNFTATLYTTSNVAGGVQAAIAGTATATSIIYEGETTAAASVGAQTRATSLGAAVGGATAVTAARIDIEGTIVVNAGGTLTVQFAQNVSNGTASSVLVGSTFTVQEFH